MTYTGAGFGGACVIPQHKLEGGLENPDGFNVTDGTRYLIHQVKAPLTISTWTRITKRRAIEFDQFVFEITQAQTPEKKGIRHLCLVTQEEEPT